MLRDREGFAEKRHRSPQEPCECRRGFVPYRFSPKPWYALVDYLQLVCSVGLGLIGWVILFGAASHAILVGGPLFVPGLFLWALAWISAGFCGWWSVAPIFEAANEENEDEERDAA